ncbi:MAG: carboxypeptidase regulatory-like domain-containing protein [Terriglobales bacterium]
MSLRLLYKRVGTLMLALIAVMGLTWVTPATAHAQDATSGTVLGQITDAQGKAIVGAVVLLTNTSTNAAQPTVTNSSGRYVFSNLQPGSYNLSVKKDGFKEATVKAQQVSVGKQTNLNVAMQVGEATQTVEVTATGAELQTMNATVGLTVSGESIGLLPSISRDVNGLAALQPNTNTDGGVCGASNDQKSLTLDGGINTDDMDGSRAVYTGTQSGPTSGTIPTPAASIEQFTVGTSNQTADVNSAAGASISMSTKRGTDTLHGEGYDYYLGSYLAANSWGNNRTGVTRAKSHRNRFGAALGGEVLPNWLGGKTYVFGNYEGLRYPNAANATYSTPTATLRAGIVAADNGNGNAAAVCGTSAANGATSCADASHKHTFYNLNPWSTTVGSQTYAPAVCTGPAGNGPCDPRGLGLNPVVAQLWSQYMPMPNLPTSGDTVNSQGYQGNVDVSTKSNFFVTRIDHDFGAKNHFDMTYHFFFQGGPDSHQHDIGGGVPGDVKGTIVATQTRPQLPSLWTAQLTTNVSSNVTNNFTYSLLRNFWQWSGSYLKPTPLNGFSALGGALEIGGESSNALIPYNVNTQSVRTRVWDGIGNSFKDSLTILHGNHLFAIGGQYTHQIDYHQRNDNGGGIMANNVYQVSSGNGVKYTYLPSDFVTGANTGAFKTAYSEVLGIVSQPQTLYTRAGAQLNLQPLGTPMFDKSSIPMYNFYFSDAWHLRPSLTLSYGVGYTIEMPPVEENGKQVALVDAAGNAVDEASWVSSMERAALSGQAYDPELGFATVGNVGAGQKYAYNPFYGGFSPRVSLAWNPNMTSGLLGTLMGGNKTVVRGGWSRIFGRLNGVDLVLVPLLGTGLGQPVSCIGASMTNSCNGPSGVTPDNAFRIGPTSYTDANGTRHFDGMTAPLGATPTTTLAQPYFPGEIQNGAVTASAGAGEFLDPKFRPDRSDEFDLTIQRQITPAFSTEIGYTGRIIRNEYQATDLSAVPIMMTAGGQKFMDAFGALWSQMNAGKNDANPLDRVTPQPFFESALGGASSGYCKSAGSCTLAVAQKEGSGKGGADNIDVEQGNYVFTMWQDLNSSSSWTLGRTTPSTPTTCTAAQAGCPANGVISGGGQLSAIFDNEAIGYGNYNSFFWSVNMRNFHGLTAGSNFTWSKSMGTGQEYQANSSYTVNNMFDLHYMYGEQQNSSPLLYNAYFVYAPGSKDQNGLWGHLAHGWSFAPIITWRRVGVGYFSGNGGKFSVSNSGQCESFGEGDCSTEYSVDQAVLKVPYTGGSGIVRHSTYGNSDPANRGTGINLFSDPAAIFSEFRPAVLGIDTTGVGGMFPGVSRTNIDFSLTKNLALTERFSAELNAQATNVLNHWSANANGFALNDAQGFGYVSNNGLGSRAVEVGFLVRW